MNEREIILTSILNCSRTALYAQNVNLTKTQEKLLDEILSLRRQNVPLQYILGYTEFMGVHIKVDKNVFIPRPETEILAEESIRLARETARPRCGVRILDIGTGSGCLAVSLSKYLPEAKITAIDVSEAALSVARENARQNSCEGKIEFLRCDLFRLGEVEACGNNAGVLNGGYDMVISNPPYIPDLEIEDLSPEVKAEPRIALSGGVDGLDFYRLIAENSGIFLKAGGLLLLEIGCGQGAGVKNIFQKSGKFEIIDLIKDYSGIERVAVFKHFEQP